MWYCVPAPAARAGGSPGCGPARLWEEVKHLTYPPPRMTGSTLGTILPQYFKPDCSGRQILSLDCREKGGWCTAHHQIILWCWCRQSLAGYTFIHPGNGSIDILFVYKLYLNKVKGWRTLSPLCQIFVISKLTTKRTIFILPTLRCKPRLGHAVVTPGQVSRQWWQHGLSCILLFCGRRCPGGAATVYATFLCLPRAKHANYYIVWREVAT